MNRKNYIFILSILFIGLGIGANAYTNDLNKTAAVTSAPPAQTAPVVQEQKKLTVPAYKKVLEQSPTNPISVVNKPYIYYNKRINVTAKFNKFTALGLDYKPAMRSSETYISFLILRPDTDKNIPLSEMKLFITRKTAEKLIDLKEGDLIKFSGIVFSTALGDAWVDVDSISKIVTEEKQK